MNPPPPPNPHHGKWGDGLYRLLILQVAAVKLTKLAIAWLGSGFACVLHAWGSGLLVAVARTAQRRPAQQCRPPKAGPARPHNHAHLRYYNLLSDYSLHSCSRSFCALKATHTKTARQAHHARAAGWRAGRSGAPRPPRTSLRCTAHAKVHAVIIPRARPHPWYIGIGEAGSPWRDSLEALIGPLQVRRHSGCAAPAQRLHTACTEPAQSPHSGCNSGCTAADPSIT